jgi:hypothetical protein
LLKVVFAFVPMLVTAVKQTTTIKDNITAYSTAVGPSSLVKNRFNFMAKLFISTLRQVFLGVPEQTSDKTPEDKAEFIATNPTFRGVSRSTTRMHRRPAVRLNTAK